MRKSFGLLVAASVLVGGTPALAKTQADQASTVNGGGQAASAPAEKKVCKAIEHTGTHRIERVCLTKKDWRRVEASIANSF